MRVGDRCIGLMSSATALCCALWRVDAPPCCACRYGFFKNKRIVLYDTLVEGCSEAEVVAVLAHELGARSTPSKHADPSVSGCSEAAHRVFGA
jgi:hypothetical protein